MRGARYCPSFMFFYLPWVSLRPHLTHEETEPGLKRHDHSPPSVFGGSLAWRTPNKTWPCPTQRAAVCR